MGWTGIYNTNLKNFKERGKFLTNEFTNETVDVIDVSRNGSTFYFALKNKKEGYVFAIVVLTQFRNNEFLFKVIDEFMCPYYSHPAKRLLKKLTPVPEKFGDNSIQNSTEWRQVCWNNFK